MWRLRRPNHARAKGEDVSCFQSAGRWPSVLSKWDWKASDTDGIIETPSGLIDLGCTGRPALVAVTNQAFARNCSRSGPAEQLCEKQVGELIRNLCLGYENTCVNVVEYEVNLSIKNISGGKCITNNLEQNKQVGTQTGLIPSIMF